MTEGTRWVLPCEEESTYIDNDILLAKTVEPYQHPTPVNEWNGRVFPLFLKTPLAKLGHFIGLVLRSLPKTLVYSCTLYTECTKWGSEHNGFLPPRKLTLAGFNPTKGTEKCPRNSDTAESVAVLTEPITATALLEMISVQILFTISIRLAFFVTSCLIVTGWLLECTLETFTAMPVSEINPTLTCGCEWTVFTNNVVEVKIMKIDSIFEPQCPPVRCGARAHFPQLQTSLVGHSVAVISPLLIRVGTELNCRLGERCPKTIANVGHFALALLTFAITSRYYGIDVAMIIWLFVRWMYSPFLEQLADIRCSFQSSVVQPFTSIKGA